MKTRYALTLSLLLPLAACSPSQAPSGETAAPAAAPVGETPAAAPAAENAPAPASAPAAPATAETAAAPNTNPVLPPQGPAPVEGTDYVVIDGGQPFDPLQGKIEVVEMFNYICPACNAFDPVLQDWKSKQPADVRVTYVPAQFRPDFVPYARAYYAAESLGLVEKSHRAVYQAIHQAHSIPAEGDAPDEAKVAAFYAQFGVSAEQFLNTMKSFAIRGKINKANQFAIRTQLEGTPSLIVNGRYRVKGRSWDDMLRITDHLVARERAAAGGAQ